jgi:hypothetical protein
MIEFHGNRLCMQMGQEHSTCTAGAECKTMGKKANGVIALPNEQNLKEQLLYL